MKIIASVIFSVFCLTAVGQNIPHPNIPAPKGLAVNSFTGNLFYQRDEQSLRGTGYRVYQSFYYNAASDTADYGYGHGWSFYYNSFYILKGSDTAIIQHSDAKKDTFLLVGGSYKAPAGVYDVLTKSGSAYVLTAKDGKKEYFENAQHKKLTRMTDPNGNYIVLEYSGNYPGKVRNSSGRCLLLSWQGDHLASAKDSAYPAKQFSYTYDQNGDLITVTNPLSNKISFEYANHTLQRLADENNSPVIITYISGSQVKTINSCNSQQDFSYNAEQHKTYVTQKAQAGTILNGYYFDGTGRLIALSDAGGNKMSFSYDNNNNLTSWKDFKGQATTYQYDSKGNLLQETDPLGNASTYTYETNFNKLTSVKDKKGNTTSFAYDSKGNLITVTQPGSISQSFKYDANGRILTAKNANNQTTTYQYNSDGDLSKIIYPIGSVQFEYNGSCCEVGKITDANGNTQEMTYDLMNRLVTVKDKTGNTIKYDYDPAGNIVKETDPNNITKQYAYDALNRLISVTLKAGTWFYDYDEQSNLVKITDANGNLTQYTYNTKNQLIKETDAIGHSTNYGYDVNGNLTSRTDPNGNAVNYTYDALNRLTQKSYAGNTDNYSYDAIGNLTSAFNNNITYTFEYDNLNRLLKKNIPTWGKSIGYTYDNAGNRKTMTDQDGGLYSYTYDGNNRLTKLVNAASLTTGFEYDAGGRILKQTNGNSTFTTCHYDAAGRMDSLINWQNSSNKISFFYYTFDNYSNRLTMRDKHGLNTYTYDSSYRLTKVVYADGSIEQFVIDGSGNRTLRIKNGDTTHYTYNGADEIQTAGVSSYAFDANGNTIQQIDTLQRSYLYDGENRLLEADLGPKKVQYLYDPFGDKIQITDTLALIKKMIYDHDNLLAELSNANSTVNTYTSALDIDKWISMQTTSGNYFYHKDGLNSTTELSSSFSVVQDQYNYDVYGNILSKNNILNNKILYAGKIYEPNLELYDNRARFYNSNVGKFINKDVTNLSNNYLSSPLLINKYAYGINNPVAYIDQNGNNPILVIVLVGALTGAAWDVGTQFYNKYFDKTNYNGFCISHVVKEAGLGGATAPIIGGILGKFGLEGLEFGWGRYFRSLLPVKNEAGIQVGGSWFGDFITNTLLLGGNKLADKLLDKLAEWGVSKAFNDFNNYLDCKDPPGLPGSDDPTNDNPVKPIKIPIEVITPGDPNYISGTIGFDTTKKWVSVNANLPYKVAYENDPAIATAPAQRVAIYVPVHEKLNPNSVRIGDFGFGSFNFTVPANTSFYTNRLDVKDSLGVYVDVTAGLDIPNNRLFWIFQSIDPATGLASSLAADAGYLPVNDSLKHNGEGYVSFTLQPKSSDSTGDTTSAYASITFDNEAALNTNTWPNTVDAVAPTSTVNALPSSVDSVFIVSWSGQDDNGGSGIKDYELYSSKNNGPFTLYQSGIDSTSTTFIGDPGAGYSFYTLATDNTGNKEAAKFQGTQGTTVKGNSVFVSVKAFLGGAYQSSEGLMTDSLRAKGLIPANQPYTGLGFIKVSNTSPELIPAGLTDSTGSKALVDWVWLELRSASDPTRVVATRSALIRRDGNVVDIDGKSAVLFPGDFEGKYYIALRHRNHLGVMTGDSITLSKTGIASVDFTNPATHTYGTNAMQNINGKMVLWAGDINGSGSISYNGANNDKNTILSKVGLATPNNVSVGYDRTDCGMDGKTSYNGASNDKNKILFSVGLTTPNNVLTEQLPH